jgi:hypothetical protein
VAAAALALAIGGDRHPDRTVAATAFLAAVAAIVWAPLLATSRRRFAAPLAAAAGCAGMLVVPSLLLGGDVAGSVGAGIGIAGFLLLVAGLAAIAAVLTRSPAAGVALGGLLGALLLASFHVGDPFIEWRGAGKGSPFALGLLLKVNPAAGAIGNALDIDWLRLPIMYSGLPGTASGGLSVAQYYYWQYPHWWLQAPVQAAIGAALLAGAGRWERLRWARA